MNNLSFGDGRKTYTVNGSVEICFNPASARFAGTLLDMVDHCQNIMNEVREKQLKVEADKAAVFELAKEQDDRIGAEIDSVFGTGKAAQLFPAGPTAWADGLPVWLNFSMAILDELNENINEQKQQAEPRLAEYMKKYEKYTRK